MAESAYTKGPWVVDETRAYFGVYGGKSGNGRDFVIATCSKPHGHAEPNARLIAAAPDLVEALISTRRVAAAHMKARGFSESDIAEAFPQTDAALRRAFGKEG